jgi:hypothetical protein
MTIWCLQFSKKKPRKFDEFLPKKLKMGSISKTILSFLNMFFYAVNVYFKFKSVEEEDNQTNPNSQQSIKDRILSFFNKSGNANGQLMV